MKRVKQIDNQVRKLSKETYKDITPATGVEFSNANSWPWAPTPISKFSETTSCCNQSIQYCQTEIDHYSEVLKQFPIFHPHDITARDIEMMPNSIK